MGKVLIACECSGTVRDAFTLLGHDATSCDLEYSRTPGKHYQGDVFDILYQDWDLIIAHPPCTYLSNVGAKHLYKGGDIDTERLAKGFEGKAFFMELLEAPCPRICVENPTPGTIFSLPKHTQVIQPYEHGHPFQKKTLLWLKNLPNLVPTNVVMERESTSVAGNWFNNCSKKDRQYIRSKTFDGIAKAMAEQWGSLL